MALESTICVGALATLAWVARALINVHTGLAVGGQLVAGVTDALEAAVHVDTASVVTHTALGALVLVAAKAAVRGMLETVLAETHIGAGCVPAVALETDERVLQALVHIDAGETGGGQRESWQAFAAEGAI